MTDIYIVVRVGSARLKLENVAMAIFMKDMDGGELKLVHIVMVMYIPDMDGAEP